MTIWCRCVWIIIAFYFQVLNRKTTPNKYIIQLRETLTLQFSLRFWDSVALQTNGFFGCRFEPDLSWLWGEPGYSGFGFIARNRPCSKENHFDDPFVCYTLFPVLPVLNFAFFLHFFFRNRLMAHLETCVCCILPNLTHALVFISSSHVIFSFFFFFNMAILAQSSSRNPATQREHWVDR